MAEHIDYMVSLFEEQDSNHYATQCKDMTGASWEELMTYYNQLNNDKNHKTNTDDECTPMECVKQMIDYIPSKLWEKKDIKVLDPCSGNGNFAAYCQYKTNLENIWLNEINPIRVANSVKILHPIHVTSKNALSITSFETWDLVMANPPYSGGGNKNRSLSNEFIEHSIKLLKKEGYLCFITPNNWMTYNNNNTTLKKLLNEGSFLVIDNDAKKYFPHVGSSFTIFVWQKGVFSNKTYIKNKFLIQDEQFDVVIPKTLKFIPLYISQNVISIIEKSIQEKESLFHYRCDLHNFTKKNLLRDKKDALFCYETIHTARKTRYACIKQDIFDKWIIVVPLSTYYVPFIKHGVNTTQSVGYFQFDSPDNAKEYIKKINRKHFKLIVHLTRYGNFNNIMVLKHLAFDTDIAFTKEERETIEYLNRNIKY